MRAPEAATSQVHRDALAAPGRTAVTRAFTGRSARGIENAFMREHEAEAPHAYPAVHYVTAPLRARAREEGDADTLHLWAGQAHELIRDVPAAELVRALHAEARAAAAEAQARLNR
jgi:nitronate monooxygenase